MKKQLLVILSIVAVAAGIFCIRNAKAGCSNGMCGRTKKTAPVKPQPASTPASARKMRRAVPKVATAVQIRKTAGRCKNGTCSR